MNLMNSPRTAREYVVWYPAASYCPVFACVGKRGIERLITVTTARNENRNQTNTEHWQQEKRFRRNHPKKDTPVARGCRHLVGKLSINA